MAAGLLFALLIAWSGHNTVQIGAAVVLMGVTLALAITGRPRPLHAGPIPPLQPGKLKVLAA